MSKGMVAGLMVLLAGTGLAIGQAPAPQAAAAVVEDDTPTAAPEGLPEAPTAGEGPCRFWISGEYLLWWIKDSHYPALLTSGSPTDALPGALGQPGTQVLFGGGNVDNQARSGGRMSAGLWLDDNGRLGVEAGYLFLGERSVGFAGGSSGAPGTGVTARPFINVLAGEQDASIVAYPGLAGGIVTVQSASAMQAGETNAVLGLCDGPHFRLEALAGFRYVHLDERLRIQENTQVSSTAAIFGQDNLGILDRFDATNDFYGAQLGGRAAFHYGRWEASLLAKVALGDAHESVDIAGVTTVAAPGQAAAVMPGGLLALPSNSGNFHRDAFSVVPEVGLRIDCRLTHRLHAFVGYSFLYWSDVARPGNQIDPSISVTQVPTSRLFGAAGGVARPAFTFNSTDFWAQGVSFGMEFRY